MNLHVEQTTKAPSDRDSLGDAFAGAQSQIYENVCNVSIGSVMVTTALPTLPNHNQYERAERQIGLDW
jgi:hypothetical protein